MERLKKVLPTGWKSIPFGKVFEFLPTLTLSRNDLTTDNSITGIYNIHYGDIHSTYKYTLLDFEKSEGVPSISNEDIDESRITFLKDGDLIIADASEDYAGVATAIELKNIGSRKVTAGLHTFAARDNMKYTIEGFRGYLLKHPWVCNEIKKLATGSKVYGVSKSNITNLELILPTLLEQQKIAQILYQWDELIEKQTQLIEAKEKRKKGLMQKLILGEERFNEFQKTVNYKKIKEVGTVVSGGTPNTNIEEYWNGDIHWCTPTEITALKGKMFIKNTNRKITSKGLTESSANLLPINSLIVCTRATIGDCAINYVPMSTNQGFKCIIPKSDVLIEYIYYVIQVLKPSLIELASGSTFLELSKSDFENIKIRVPEIEEQKKISSILISLDQEIEILKTEFEAFKFQKTGLMQQLLTGKIRVKL